MGRLFTIEILAAALFVALAISTVWNTPAIVRPIDAAALATGPAEESWTGIFIGEQHVGYSVSRESPTAGGGRLFEQRASFAIGAMGTTQQVTTGGTAVTDAEGRLVKFDFLLSSPVLVVARGDVRPGIVHVEIQQGDQVNVLDVPVAEAPALSLTATNVVRGKDIKPGDTFELPYFDPITVTPSTMRVTVEAPELLPNGEVAHWLRMEAGGVTTRRLVDAQGVTLREEGALGLRSVRMTKEEAMAVDVGDAPDLVSLAKTPLVGFIDPAKPFGPLTLKVTGVPEGTVPAEGDIQTIQGELVTLFTPPESEWPVFPVAGLGDTEPSLSLPSTNPEILAKAVEVIGDATDRATAARRLADFVFRYVTKAPTIGIPNGLEVLRSGQGDCNEHTALYVSLARAVNIPSRIAAGLVYNADLGHSFYYHAWPEVKLGPGESWVAIDPTFGQFPAQATHLKLVTGDLDRQIEILGAMGKIRLEVATNPQQADKLAAP